MSIIGKKFDFHIHTNISDGDSSPDDIYEIALKHNDISTITDHDKPTYHFEKTDCSFTGVEITTRIKKQAIELLIYGFDKEAIPVLNRFEARIDAQEKIFYILFDKLKSKGCVFDSEIWFDRKKLFAHSQMYDFLTLPSVVENNKNKLGKLLETRTNLYHQGQSKDSDIYIEDSYDLNIESIIELLQPIKQRTNCKIFLAHPFYYACDVKTTIDNALPYIDGIECLHPSALDSDSVWLFNYCKENNKQASGGSDYHGGEYTGTPYNYLACNYEELFEWVDELEENSNN